MDRKLEGATAIRGEVAPAAVWADENALAWYKVVGIELVLFAGIVVPLICGALLAR